MGAQSVVRRLVEMTGHKLHRISQDVYDQDGLYTIHNHEFMADLDFRRAYERGCKAAGSTASEYGWHWRVHIGLWAADMASKLGGDFVECGVNYGFLSSAIMEYLDWNRQSSTFYLLDTFQGLDEKQVSREESERRAVKKNKEWLDSGFYVNDVERVRANFAEWKNVKIIQGTIPGTLSQIDARRIAYLHLDMNCSAPEVAAFNFLWDRLLPGATVLLDDYAYHGYESQKRAMDAEARTKNVSIASLPTGQGMLIKPPAAA